jgi:hypothetical protein
MASFAQGFSAIVGSGSVSPSTFVNFMTGTAASGDVIAGYAVQQSVVSSLPIGIAQEGARYAPTDENTALTYAGAYTGVAGYTGDPIKVYTIGDICLLSLGTTVTPGQLLGPDANGKGIVISTANIAYGATAIEGGSSGDLIRVQVNAGVY